MPLDPLASVLSVLSVAEDGDRAAVRFAAGTALTEANAEAVGGRLAALAAAQPRPHLTLDLGGVTMLTSVVLAKLISLNGKVRAAGGRLTLTNPTPAVRQVFRVTRLDTLLDIRTASEALSA